MARTPWGRIALAAMPPALVSLWLATPMLQPAPVTVAGPAASAEACLSLGVDLCRPVLQVQGLRLSCGYDFIGQPVACRERVRAPGEVQATYIPLPSAAGLLGRAPVQGTLLRLDRDGEPVYRRSLQAQVWAAVYGGWLFHAIYWPLAGLVIWRWPASRFARRVTWQD